MSPPMIRSACLAQGVAYAAKPTLVPCSQLVVSCLQRVMIADVNGNAIQ